MYLMERECKCLVRGLMKGIEIDLFVYIGIMLLYYLVF